MKIFPPTISQKSILKEFAHFTKHNIKTPLSRALGVGRRALGAMGEKLYSICRHFDVFMQGRRIFVDDFDLFEQIYTPLKLVKTKSTLTNKHDHLWE
jgi:hypothetical protein